MPSPASSDNNLEVGTRPHLAERKWLASKGLVMHRVSLLSSLVLGLIGGLLAGALPANAAPWSVSTASGNYLEVFDRLCVDEDCNPFGDFFVWQTPHGEDPETVLYLDEDDICGTIAVPANTYYGYYRDGEVVLGWTDDVGLRASDKCMLVMSTHPINDYVTLDEHLFQDPFLTENTSAYDWYVTLWTVPQIAEIVPESHLCFDWLAITPGGRQVLTTWLGDSLVSTSDMPIENACGHTLVWLTNYV